MTFLRTRHAPLLVVSIVLAGGCSSARDAPPVAGAQSTAGATSGAVIARADPGPVTAPVGAAVEALGRARPAAEELERKAAVLRPTAAEVRWKEIPWMTSVVEAQKVAQAEKRPVLMWISDDDPLDRC